MSVDTIIRAVDDLMLALGEEGLTLTSIKLKGDQRRRLEWLMTKYAKDNDIPFRRYTMSQHTQILGMDIFDER